MTGNSMISGQGGLPSRPMDDHNYVLHNDSSIVDQMLYDPELAKRVMHIADIFSNSPTAPEHCQNNPAIVIQAMDIARTTKLNILFILNSMFQPARGAKVGVTSELVLASLMSTGSIIGDPEWEFIGDWDKVKGKHTQAQSKNNSGKTYTKATYTAEDEKGLGINLTIHWSDREEPTTYGPYWLIDQQPRFSTLWATDPSTQMKYKVLRTVVRHNRPNLLNQVCVGEEAMLQEQHVGPDRAKVVGSGSTKEDAVADRLEDVKKRSRNKNKPKENIPPPMPLGPPETAPMPMPNVDEGHQILEHEDTTTVHQNNQEMMFEDELGYPDDEPTPTVIWLNPSQTAYKIPKNKTWVQVFCLAVEKADNIEAVFKLQEQNQQYIANLGETDKKQIRGAMDSKAAILNA